MQPDGQTDIRIGSGIGKQSASQQGECNARQRWMGMSNWCFCDYIALEWTGLYLAGLIVCIFACMDLHHRTGARAYRIHVAVISTWRSFVTVIFVSVAWREHFISFFFFFHLFGFEYRHNSYICFTLFICLVAKLHQREGWFH
ncbi:hypothetical protein BKA64DRAFT_264627 [Cadophora sp. MPI-SDFR-AT-0126]|nr:hypothetical protein BKA64DRAFT_264627 [Leotiomycetes sp. MPI-SDFR-AT-0126]